MKGLFANLYNEVLKFFHQTETKHGESAKDVACNRLKLVLMQDRTNLSPAIMDRMRNELIDLLSKYLELDRELLDLNFEQEDEQMALMLSIPVIRAKDEEEILELLRQEDEGTGVDDEGNDEVDDTDDEIEKDADVVSDEDDEVDETSHEVTEADNEETDESDEEDDESETETEEAETELSDSDDRE